MKKSVWVINLFAPAAVLIPLAVNSFCSVRWCLNGTEARRRDRSSCPLKCLSYRGFSKDPPYLSLVTVTQTISTE